MVAVLIVEIVSALVAAGIALYLAIAFLVGCVRTGKPGRPAHHVGLSLVLMATALLHGIAATVYASGAPAAAYMLGWAALVVLVAAGALAAVRRARGVPASSAHIALFFVAMALVAAHAIMARA